jgi:hypothetical protein
MGLEVGAERNRNETCLQNEQLISLAAQLSREIDWRVS